MVGFVVRLCLSDQSERPGLVAPAATWRLLRSSGIDQRYRHDAPHPMNAQEEPRDRQRSECMHLSSSHFFLLTSHPLLRLHTLPYYYSGRASLCYECKMHVFASDMYSHTRKRMAAVWWGTAMGCFPQAFVCAGGGVQTFTCVSFSSEHEPLAGVSAGARELRPRAGRVVQERQD